MSKRGAVMSLQGDAPGLCAERQVPPLPLFMAAAVNRDDSMTFLRVGGASKAE